MSSYMQVKKAMDDSGVQHEDMDAMWSAMYHTNKIVKNLTDHGQHWYDLPDHLLRQVKEQYLTEAKS